MCISCTLSVLAAPTFLGYATAAEDFVASKVPAAIATALTVIYFVTQALESRAAMVQRWRYYKSEDERRAWVRKWFFSYLDNWILVIGSLIGCIQILGSTDAKVAHSDQSVRISLAIAQMFAWYQTFNNAFLPFERFGVFTIVVQQMIIADVFTWMVISSPILGAIVIGSNAVSPGSAEAPFDWLTHTHNWASIFDATESIMMMTLIGEPSDVRTHMSAEPVCSTRAASARHRTQEMCHEESVLCHCARPPQDGVLCAITAGRC